MRAARCAPPRDTPARPQGMKKADQQFYLEAFGLSDASAAAAPPAPPSAAAAGAVPAPEPPAGAGAVASADTLPASKQAGGKGMGKASMASKMEVTCTLTSACCLVLSLSMSARDARAGGHERPFQDALRSIEDQSQLQNLDLQPGCSPGCELHRGPQACADLFSQLFCATASDRFAAAAMATGRTPPISG